MERMRPYLDLVALATVADIVALKGDNRILVKFGLVLHIRTKPAANESLQYYDQNLYKCRSYKL